MGYQKFLGCLVSRSLGFEIPKASNPETEEPSNLKGYIFVGLTRKKTPNVSGFFP